MPLSSSSASSVAPVASKAMAAVVSPSKVTRKEPLEALHVMVCFSGWTVPVPVPVPTVLTIWISSLLSAEVSIVWTSVWTVLLTLTLCSASTKSEVNHSMKYSSTGSRAGGLHETRSVSLWIVSRATPSGLPGRCESGTSWRGVESSAGPKPMALVAETRT